MTESQRQAVEEMVKSTGVALNGEGEMSGWSGGEVWLVPTDKAIEDWKPIAVRKL